MAYVPGYNYDIFISFTHQDNDRLPGLEHGWVDEFHFQLEKAIGFPMHDAEGDELGDFTDPTDSRFGKQLRKVVDAVETTLNALRGQQQAAQPQPLSTASTGASRPRVFLATVAESQEQTRDRLLNEIGDRAELLAELPPPHEHAAHREQLEASLRQADLSIHLLDGDPGDRIQDLKQTTYPREQVEVALAQPLRQLIWLPPGLVIDNITNADYRELIEQLDSGERGKDNIELLRCEPTELYSLVLARLADVAPPAAVGDPARFLIDTHQKDQRYAWRLADLLAERAADVDVNKESQDPTRSLDLFRDAVRQAQNLIILFGQVETPWLSNRITEAIKVIGGQLANGETAVLERLWVLMLPGSPGLPADLRIPPIIKLNPIDNRDDDAIDPARLDELLAPGASGVRP
jgi:hypothetical protein